VAAEPPRAGSTPRVQDILAAGLALQWPLFALHLVGGVAGYWLPRLFGQARPRRAGCPHPSCTRIEPAP